MSPVLRLFSGEQIGMSEKLGIFLGSFSKTIQTSAGYSLTTVLRDIHFARTSL